ncbi:sporulation protein YabP [Clostridium sp. DSM 8431]|uniref:sporulation protein YabP n=1 Tax=Clostridium sp. DSM 8431 TaxID=1761781 RepID=UPI000B7F7494|nr:sporulation protein YabP [Clostridium sp. DSM 8431]
MWEKDMDEIKKSNLSLENRKKLTLTGVIEIINFDEETILLNTSLGKITVKGEGLKVDKLDVQNGEVIIAGMISSLVYSKKGVKKSKKDFIKRIFK